MTASAFYLAYVGSGLLAKPDWDQALVSLIKPVVHKDPDYLLMIVGMIGATIGPWMLFYLQAAIVENAPR